MKEKTTIMEKLSTKKSKLLMASSAVMACVMALPLTASADEVTPAFPVTSAMLAPVTSTMNSAISVAVPVGIGVMAVLLGVYLVPKIIKRLAK